jgi:DNA-binding transcriptional ArsR family regulator
MSPRSAEFIPTRAAALFSALGDTTRLALLARLKDGQAQSLVELSHGMSLTRQGVSKHLRVLADAGMVTSRRVGRESRYVLRPAGISEAKSHLERASRQWDEALARLKALIG